VQKACHISTTTTSLHRITNDVQSSQNLNATFPHREMLVLFLRLMVTTIVMTLNSAITYDTQAGS